MTNEHEGKRPAAALHLKSALELEAEEVRWLWPDRFAMGALSIIQGDPGAGKSFVSCFIASRITTGRSWPDSEARANPGSVMFISDEDHPARVRSRLEAMGANLAKCVLLSGVTAGKDKPAFDLTRHLPALEDAWRSIPDLQLCVFDPVTAYMPVNQNANAEVRAALTPLAALAARLKIAVVAISHYNKTTGASYIYRGLGSTAFVAQARSVYGIVRDLRDDEAKLFLPIKNSYGNGETKGLRFRITEEQVRFDREAVHSSIDDYIAKTRKTSKLAGAADWLCKRLASGPVEATKLLQDGQAEGFASATLRRARKELPIEVYRTGFQTPWNWKLNGQETAEEHPEETDHEPPF